MVHSQEIDYERKVPLYEEQLNNTRILKLGE